MGLKRFYGFKKDLESVTNVYFKQREKSNKLRLRSKRSNSLVYIYRRTRKTSLQRENHSLANNYRNHYTHSFRNNYIIFFIQRAVKDAKITSETFF